MQDMVNNIINELAMTDISRKQRSIKSLFPTFDDRVKNVAAAGGVRLVERELDQWNFEVHSAERNIWYQDVVKFKNLPETIAKHARNKMLWNKDKTRVDTRFLAQAVLDDVDIEIFCSCPAFQYWGPAYILTQRGAKYTAPEDRPPRIRNPKQYGAMCKHMQLVFDVLSFFGGDMSKHIREFYPDIVAQAEEEVLKTTQAVKKAASTFKKKEAGEEEETEQEEPVSYGRGAKPVRFAKKKEKPVEGEGIPPETEQGT
jgi:hypothetical protein